MRLIFLGTNGWFPTKAGNTTCAAIVLEDRLIVLDAGDGFYRAREIAEKAKINKIDIFLSHLHLDHTIGLHTLPRMPEWMNVRIFVHQSYVPALKTLLDHPYTADFSQLYAKVEIVPLKQGENLLPYKVQVLPLVHADPCFGFRFELEGKSLAYCTDTGPCKNIVALAKGVDVLVTECTLLPGAPELKDWPHLSPEMAASAAKESGAARLLLTHFDASKYSALELRKEAEKAAKKIFAKTTAACDGLEILL